MNKIKTIFSGIGYFVAKRTTLILIMLCFVSIVFCVSTVIFFVTKNKVTRSKILLEKDFENMVLTKEQCVNYMEKLESFKKALDIELRESEKKMKQLKRQLEAEKQKNRELILEAKRNEDFALRMKSEAEKYRKEKSDIIKRMEIVNKDLDSTKAGYDALVAEKGAFTRKMEEMTARLEELSKEDSSQPFAIFGVR